MKKIIAFLLAAIICLTFAACTNNETESTGSSSTSSSSGSVETFENHPHLAFIYGQWELQKLDSYNQDEIPCTKLLINEDGTCVADEASGTWVISHETREDFLRIDIYIGNEHRYCVAYYSKAASIAVWNVGYTGGVDTNWQNLSAVEYISITPENWKNYFELVTETTFQYNEFDEMQRMTFTQYLVLKEEYASKITTQDLVLEISASATRCKLAIDVYNADYSLGDIIEEVELSAEVKELEENSKDYRISMILSYVAVDESTDTNCAEGENIVILHSLDNITVLRAKGSICVSNK